MTRNSSTTLKYKVFISHSSVDTWVCEQIRLGIMRCGADAFLDSTDIADGDDIDERILQEAEGCQELLVLLTPWARSRPYIWMEVFLFWHAKWRGERKRIVPVLYGLNREEVFSGRDVPGLISQLRCIDVNNMPTYFVSLSQRVRGSGGIDEDEQC